MSIIDKDDPSWHIWVVAMKHEIWAYLVINCSTLYKKDRYIRTMSLSPDALHNDYSINRFGDELIKSLNVRRYPKDQDMHTTSYTHAHAYIHTMCDHTALTCSRCTPVVMSDMDGSTVSFYHGSEPYVPPLSTMTTHCW